MLTFLIPGNFYSPLISISLSKWPILPTIALFFILAIWSMVIIFLLPVAEINISPYSTILSSLTTLIPSIRAWSAQIGSTSVT